MRFYVDYKTIAEYTGIYSKAFIKLILVNIYGVEILTTDQEILARIGEIEKRMERMEAALESINNILKKVEQNTYFGCYMPEGKLE
ncbi:hypothetical protein [Methanosarcina sp.]|uniref:hypothetical protein n=1 Tax=Methanosarcina sp. TaxID=2213 RepID=UPI003C733442